MASQSTPTTLPSVRSAATPTQNACHQCMPLGACLAYRGVEGAMPLLHGSQGCATYIRRFLIGHFREPVDIASSSFDEASAIFGGGTNLETATRNVIELYQPRVLGIASTCLSETIGDDLGMLAQQCEAAVGRPDMHFVHVSTPAYRGSQADGYHAATRALVEKLAERNGESIVHAVNLFPGMLSPGDLRHLSEILVDFGLGPDLIPDYSDPLDGPALTEYTPIPAGGVSLGRIAEAGRAGRSLFLGQSVPEELRASAFLEAELGVEEKVLPIPVGVRATDLLFRALEDAAGRKMPAKHALERGRLLDSYVDAHKYVHDKKAVVVGEPDLVAGIVSLLVEVGMTPVLCAAGSAKGRLRRALEGVHGFQEQLTTVLEDADYADIADATRIMRPDVLIGPSKGYPLSRQLGIPLLRVGFPIHDRMGGQRKLHVGYRGTQQLFDSLANSILETRQDACPVGYGSW